MAQLLQIQAVGCSQWEEIEKKVGKGKQKKSSTRLYMFDHANYKTKTKLKIWLDLGH